MKAAVRTRFGPPDVVAVRAVPEPVAGPRDLLVRVHATTVNRTDCAYRAGHPAIARPVYGLRRPRASVLGNEFAGTVTGVGSAVRSFTVGDRVFGYVEGRFGGHAEYLTVPEDASVTTVPPGWSFADVVPAVEGAHYALPALRGLGPGKSVLVNGATGGIGSAAVQLAKHAGAEVTAVAAGIHRDLVTTLGADRVIDYTSTDFTADPQRYDVVLDAVGKSSFGRCRTLLVPAGTYVSSELGPWSMNPLLAVGTPLLRGRRVRFPIPTHDRAMVERFRDLIAAGVYRPLVDRRYPLDQIVEAYRYVETGQKVGNVVVEVIPEA